MITVAQYYLLKMLSVHGFNWIGIEQTGECVAFKYTPQKVWIDEVEYMWKDIEGKEEDSTNIFFPCLDGMEDDIENDLININELLDKYKEIGDRFKDE